MVYRKFKDLQISGLGFGTMRYPIIDGQSGQIDKEAAREMIAYAMAHGVNYYDTAWGYHAGTSEVVTGELLKEYPRDSFYLATKFPGYDTSNFGKVEEIFEAQLARCQVDYFDFYLIHNVDEHNINYYLDDETYKTVSYLLKQKELGRIRHLGFSFHSMYDTTKKYLEAYGQYMEFAQIQLNWLDWTYQRAKEHVELLREYNLPIWVMEPLRGGKLVNLDAADAKRLEELRPNESIPGWAFRFLQTMPDVTTILSGMSNLEQVKQNVEIFAAEAPLSESENAALLTLADEILERTLVPCTACRYCTPYCPQELDIPTILTACNEYAMTGGGWQVDTIIGGLKKGKRPADCIGCRACEGVCPQKLGISEAIQDLSKKIGK